MPGQKKYIMDQKILTDLLGYTAVVVGAGMFLPQAIKLWRTKETKGISLLSFSLLTLVSLLWTIYGLLLGAMPIILVNIIIFILSLFIVFMKLKYK